MYKKCYSTTGHEVPIAHKYRAPDGTTYRANPSLRDSRGTSLAGWNDWAYVEWDVPVTEMLKLERTQTGQLKRGNRVTDQRVPAEDPNFSKTGGLVCVHILLFLRIENVVNPGDDTGLNSWPVDEPGDYLVCHAVTQRVPVECDGSLLVENIAKDQKTDDESNDRNLLLYLIPVEKLKKPCVCVPNIRGNKVRRDLGIDKAIPHKVDHLLIRSRKEWPEIFERMMREANTRPPPARPNWNEHNAKTERREEDERKKRRNTKRGSGGTKRKRAPKGQGGGASHKRKPVILDSSSSEEDSSDENETIANMSMRKNK